MDHDRAPIPAMNLDDFILVKRCTGPRETRDNDRGRAAAAAAQGSSVKRRKMNTKRARLAGGARGAGRHTCGAWGRRSAAGSHHFHLPQRNRKIVVSVCTVCPPQRQPLLVGLEQRYIVRVADRQTRADAQSDCINELSADCLVCKRDGPFGAEERLDVSSSTDAPACVTVEESRARGRELECSGCATGVLSQRAARGISHAHMSLNEIS